MEGSGGKKRQQVSIASISPAKPGSQALGRMHAGKHVDETLDGQLEALGSAEEMPAEAHLQEACGLGEKVWSLLRRQEGETGGA